MTKKNITELEPSELSEISGGKPSGKETLAQQKERLKVAQERRSQALKDEAEVKKASGK